jgi:hypothetical protein
VEYLEDIIREIHIFIHLVFGPPFTPLTSPPPAPPLLVVSVSKEIFMKTQYEMLKTRHLIMHKVGEEL